MGIEYETDEPEYEDIMTMLEEGTVMRDKGRQKDTPELTVKDHRLSQCESNESDIYEENADNAPATDHRPAKNCSNKKSVSASTSSHTSDQGVGAGKKQRKKVSVIDVMKTEKALQELEKNYIDSEFDTLNNAQKKYIRNFKRAMGLKFRSYSDLINFCNDFSKKRRMIHPEEFLFYHVIFTMAHPEIYANLFCFDPFCERIETGGKFTLINDFRLHLS